MHDLGENIYIIVQLERNPTDNGYKGGSKIYKFTKSNIKWSSYK
jgi:hypothetical protein